MYGKKVFNIIGVLKPSLKVLGLGGKIPAITS
jgi:hypothetical protein